MTISVTPHPVHLVVRLPYNRPQEEEAVPDPIPVCLLRLCDLDGH
jgi:hypothetical protein